ncbi:phenylalanine--tRNA ligase, beta subunit [Actinomyces graevenitzii F0530]|uniref:Phenylalanine--tRNA ligase beta subunit n=1 Tax=Actinomyces graevenitzii F0530 TaxID=1321817 RepID=U1Q4Y2_9ACTO|nr:phenylalanine--tRNA ligase subunit beta [Actinomyces graevenitzii]ERH17229.1 phenylalanine--tRNA ligase, beta subunit [Actinomyces graevenitzii F0530]
MPYVPLEWLRQYVQVRPGTDAAALAADLVKVGLEEEQIVPARVTGPLVVGKVLTQEPKEQSNGKVINYCRVDVGEQHNDAPGTGKEPSELPSRGIICGAHNFKPGDSVVVSLPGALLPGDFKIAARKTYGHISDGMICSAAELGFPDDGKHGIIVLDERYPEGEVPAPGTDALPLLGLDDEVVEINVTPDRGYCFSMRGVAREYSHSTGGAYQDPADTTNADFYPQGLQAPGNDGPRVEVNDEAPINGVPGCDRYVARLVEGVNPNAPTPDWMSRRLQASGMRSISLAVDVTNYVMLELGQPLHAFDADKLTLPLVVRRAQVGEKLTTLDDVERVLDPQDLVISDGEGGSRVLAIAGVMGGATSEVTETTTNVLIEAAHFHPVSVARSARRHKLPTESSKRFERGVDYQLAPVAAQRAADLLVRYGGGSYGPITEIDRTQAPAPIEFALDAASRLTGVDYPREQVVGLLREIGCQVNDDGGATVQVSVPSWRPDLTGSAELVEEIARLDGYDNIPVQLPVAPAGTGLTFAQRARRDIVRTVAEQGLTQVLSYPFVGDIYDRLEMPADDERRQAVRIANPLADDAPLLRTSVLDSLIDVAVRNVSRGIGDVALYEVGNVTTSAGVVPAPIPGVAQRPSQAEIDALAAGTPRQRLHLGAILCGQHGYSGVLQHVRNWDWADAVELVRDIASLLGVKLHVANAERAPWHPGRCAEIRIVVPTKNPTRPQIGEVIGYAGELHPRIVKKLGLPERACAVELDLDALIERSSSQPVVKAQPVSTYPAAKEDFAFVVDEATPSQAVAAAIIIAGGKLLDDVRLFDVYRGPQLGPGRKSLAFSVRLRASDHTLSASETEAARARIIKQVGKYTGAKLRA